VHTAAMLAVGSTIAMGVCRAFDTLAWRRSAPRILARPVE
jgi:hypothetical protein